MDFHASFREFSWIGEYLGNAPSVHVRRLTRQSVKSWQPIQGRIRLTAVHDRVANDGSPRRSDAGFSL
jgi:hypothetical protein